MQISSFSQPFHVFSQDHPRPFVADSKKKERKKKTSALRKIAHVPTSCPRDQSGPSPAEDKADVGPCCFGAALGASIDMGGGSRRRRCGRTGIQPWWRIVVRISLLVVLLMCPTRTGGKAMWSKTDRETTQHLPKSKPLLYYPTPLQPIAPNISSRCCWEANGREPKVYREE